MLRAIRVQHPQAKYSLIYPFTLYLFTLSKPSCRFEIFVFVLTSSSIAELGSIRLSVCDTLKLQSPTDSFACHSPYYFPLTSGSTTNLVFVSLTRTFRLSLFALHSQTSLPVPTSPPSCISTARCPPQPRYSHRDHLSQPTYP